MTYYRIDKNNLDSASRITVKNWLIEEGVLVPVRVTRDDLRDIADAAGIDRPTLFYLLSELRDAAVRGEGDD